MSIINRVGLLAGTLLAATVLSAPAEAQSRFTFAFTAPLSNSDTASGSGTLTTAAADALGRYKVLGAEGSFIWYQPSPDDPQPTSHAIDGASGFTGFLAPADAYLSQEATGAFTTDRLIFTGDDGFFAFGRNQDGLYSGLTADFVGINGATLTFSPSAGAVPEPATWAMMLAGFGAIGIAARRRRVAVRFA